jgi:beta-lactamase regulating signal transducer with metallopeptidase domain
MVAWLVLHTLTALFLAVLALLLGRTLRLGPAARHILWLVVLLKLLTPPLVRWPWSVPLPEAAPAAAPPAAATWDDPATDPVPILVRAPEVGRAPDPDAPLIVEEEAPVSFPAAGRLGPSAEDLLVTVWLLGGVYLAAVQFARLGRLRRSLAETRPAPAWLRTLVHQLALEMGVRTPLIAVLPGLGSPLVWGCGRVRLLWPEGLEDSLSAEALRAVLVHELAHLRRRDHWVGWLLLAGACAWWWHPLYWWVRRRLGREAELACDAWVVAALPEARRQYAEALLTVCQRRSAAALTLALGAARPAAGPGKETGHGDA